jgi:hypothetical protein
VRTWRGEGWVSPTSTRSLGRARGKASWNDPAAADQASEIAEIRAGKRTAPEQITFTLFARGRETATVDVLRRAYSTYFDELDEALGHGDDIDADERFAQADALTATFAKASRRSHPGRQMMRRLRRGDRHASAAFMTVSAWTLFVLTGEDLAGIDHPDDIDGTASPLAELRTATGLAAATEEHIGGLGPLLISGTQHRADLLRVLSKINLANIRHVALTADLDELAWGRDAVQTLVRFATAWTSTMSRTTGSQDAMGFAGLADLTLDETVVSVVAPALLLLRTCFPGLVVGVEDLRTQTPVWEARSRLLDQLPPHLHQCLGPGGERLQTELPRNDRDLLRSHIQAVERDQPHLWAQLIDGNRNA